jgi:hypothetical protein
MAGASSAPTQPSAPPASKLKLRSDIARLRHLLELERKRLPPPKRAQHDTNNAQAWLALRAACRDIGHQLRHRNGCTRCYVCRAVDL